MSKPKILRRERFYVPMEHVSAEQLEAVETRFTKQLYSEANCKKCEYFHDRPSETCDACPSNLGEYKLHVSRTFKETEYLGIPQSASKFLDKHFDLEDFRVIDRRPTKKFKHDIEFTGKLRPEQEEAVKALLEVYELDGGCGTLSAPPRSGKTVMATALMCRMRQKVLILAKQQDWLSQFYETMCGSDSQKPLTNIPDIEKFIGKKIVGMCKKLEDFQKYDICLATYQTFLSSNGKLKYKELRDEFPIIIVDEVHGVGAAEFSKILNGFNTYIRLGLTGTFERKDGMHWLVGHIAGPIVHSVKVETLSPEISIVLTKYDKNLPRSWTFALRRLCDDMDRNKLIVKHILAAVKDGHSCVVPTVFVKHAEKLVRMINRRAKENIAIAFTGKSDRREVVLGARSGKYKVVVGTRSIVQTGINVPAWSYIAEILPSSNIPNCRQRLARILTPVKGKPTPVVQYFLDEVKLSRSCFSNEYYNGVLPFIKPTVNQYTRMLIKDYISGKTGKAKDQIGGEF